jgi:hypothetical protein
MNGYSLGLPNELQDLQEYFRIQKPVVFYATDKPLDMDHLWS